MTGQEPGRLLLDKIDAREQALAREAEQARALMEDLAARLRELDEAIDHLRITRKTLLSLAGEPGTGPDRRRLPSCPAIPLPADPGRLRRCRRADAEHATCARPWTCPSCPRTPRTSAPSSNAWSAAASSSRQSRDCSHSRARSPAASLQPARLTQPQRRKGHPLANRLFRSLPAASGSRELSRRPGYPGRARARPGYRVLPIAAGGLFQAMSRALLMLQLPIKVATALRCRSDGQFGGGFEGLPDGLLGPRPAADPPSGSQPGAGSACEGRQGRARADHRYRQVVVDVGVHACERGLDRLDPRRIALFRQRAPG